MKKIISLIAATVLSVTAVIAEGNEHNLGIGITFPISSLKIGDDVDESLSQKGMGFDVTYLFIHDSGITAKADCTLALVSSSVSGEDPDNGLNWTIDLGIGYTFLRNEKFSLSALGMIGYNYSEAGFGDSESAKISFTMKTIDFGADVIGKYKFTNHLGAFANLGFRYSIDKGSSYEYSDYNNSLKFSDDAKTSGFRFVPTLGLNWTF